MKFFKCKRNVYFYLKILLNNIKNVRFVLLIITINETWLKILILWHLLLCYILYIYKYVNNYVSTKKLGSVYMAWFLQRLTKRTHDSFTLTSPHTCVTSKLCVFSIMRTKGKRTILQLLPGVGCPWPINPVRNITFHKIFILANKLKTSLTLCLKLFINSWYIYTYNW